MYKYLQVAFCHSVFVNTFLLCTHKTFLLRFTTQRDISSSKHLGYSHKSNEKIETTFVCVVNKNTHLSKMKSENAVGPMCLLLV